jgi:hypothetical protein
VYFPQGHGKIRLLIILILKKEYVTIPLNYYGKDVSPDLQAEATGRRGVISLPLPKSWVLFAEAAADRRSVLL